MSLSHSFGLGLIIVSDSLGHAGMFFAGFHSFIESLFPFIAGVFSQLLKRLYL